MWDFDFLNQDNPGFAWNGGISWDTEIGVLKLGKSQANWKELVTLEDGPMEPMETEYLKPLKAPIVRPQLQGSLGLGAQDM